MSEAVDLAPRIIADKAICAGKPVIKGTRMPVYLVLEKLAGGMKQEDLCDEYRLEREDILAALGFAAKVLTSWEVSPIES